MELLDSTFDALIEEVEEAFDTINHLRENLELKVRKRTEELERSNQNLQNTIMELQQTQMQLVQSEKMASLGLIATGFGHEINNALNYISGAIVPLNSLCRKIVKNANKGECISKNDEKQIEILLDYTETGVKRISSFVRDIMSFARPVETTYRPVNINKELDTAIRLLSLKKNGDISVKTNFGDLKRYPAFSSQLGQVFLNILLNARQAIKNQGTITITTRASEKNITIIVEDDGCGIEAEILPSIFDPFFTTKKPGKGTGLGLGICRTIVKKYGGEITVESEAGKGTSFTITLPLSKKES
jgi:signal transduction histidine kinase